MAAPSAGGAKSDLNISAATAIKTTAGTINRVVVNTAPSVIGGIYDHNATGGGAAELIAIIPTGVTVPYIIDLDWPCSTGIAVDPGTGGVIAVSYT